ncbi:pyrimidine 5'-nucleotidase [Yoonia sp. SS1-5]|uniref:Pyrimidine 5'-nucleotidase n=1 Tax=Yoonia rhodophyticola TaxID=3137370 RepID=A0AAN0MDC1_9RHOB
MVAANFAHVDSWVFDLDNTLYHPSADLFGQMNKTFAAYVMRITGLDAAGAHDRCVAYWKSHGSTLVGLMQDHDVDPHDFLAKVHDIDISHLEPDPALAARIKALPGRKIVYTNGSHNHAKRVLAARGLSLSFDAVYGVEQAGFRPKPSAGAFEAVFATDGIAPKRAAMFEDEARNLAVPHQIGMKTVHVHDTPETGDHIHHHTSDLAAFLSQLA